MFLRRTLAICLFYWFRAFDDGVISRVNVECVTGVSHGCVTDNQGPYREFFDNAHDLIVVATRGGIRFFPTL